MGLKLKLMLLSGLTAIVNAKILNFSVVSLLDTDFKVGLKYNGEVIPLKAEVFPLFKGSVESGSSNKYKYVMLDANNEIVEEEEFERTFDTSKDSTLNEVFNRSKVIHQMKSLPKIYDPLFPYETDDYPNYKENEIYTIYAQCNEEQYEHLKYNPFVGGYLKNEDSANCTVTIIDSSDVYTKTSTLSLVGYNSRLYKKLSWKFKLDKKINGRKTFKLRGLPSDPSLVRDRLSTALVDSVGIPSLSHSYARLFINDEVWGLYALVDTIGDKWISANVHGDSKHRVGYTYKMYSSVPNGPFASLRYLGDSAEVYENSGSYEVDEIDKLDTGVANDFSRLSEFTKALENWVKKYENDQSSIAIQKLEDFFYIEPLLREMAIESLTFAYDNFWAQLGNYALYRHPDDGRYLILPYDFDGTFYGTMGSPYYEESSITDCIGWANGTPVDKYFVNSLFSHDIIINRYNYILKDILEKLFKDDVISTYVDSLHDLLSEEVEWNFDSINYIDEKVPGYSNHWTLQDFEDNINYSPVYYYPERNSNDAPYGVKQWVKERSHYCSKYVNGLGDLLGSTNNKPSVDLGDGKNDVLIGDSAQPTLSIPLTSSIIPTTTTTTTTLEPTTTTTTTTTTIRTTTIRPTTTTTTKITTTVKPITTTTVAVTSSIPSTTTKTTTSKKKVVTKVVTVKKIKTVIVYKTKA